MPTLEIIAEPMDALKRRYQRALAFRYDWFEVARESSLRPGECRDNVFDCPDGIRLIISLEDWHPRDGTVLHVSASFLLDSSVGRQVKRIARLYGSDSALGAFQGHSVNKFRQISGDLSTPIEFLGYCGPNRIPHWCRKWEGASS